MSSEDDLFLELRYHKEVEAIGAFTKYYTLDEENRFHSNDDLPAVILVTKEWKIEYWYVHGTQVDRKDYDYT